jgi:uncharacterized protein (DUF58 family)
MIASLSRFFARRFQGSGSIVAEGAVSPSSTDYAWDPQFLQKLERLSVPWARSARGGETGERLTRRDGGGYDFFGHRAYDPADDFRAVDWLVYARTGKLFTRTREHAENVAVTVLLDGTASMGLPSIRWQRTRELALALAFLSLRQGDRFQVVVGGGEGIRRSRSWHGRSRWPEAARFLAELPPPGGAQDWGEMIRGLPQDARAGGALVWIGDFLGSSDPGPTIEALGRRWGQLIIWQILAAEEIHPPWRGPQVWRDVETGELRQGEVTEEVVRASQLHLRQRVESVRQATLRHGGRHEVISLAEPWEESIGPLLNRWCANP